MLILGIETSCDETAAAVVSENRDILSNRILSQVKEHSPYGGVVPELAARAHLNHLNDIILSSMQDAAIDFSDLDAVAVTGGPGLIGGVIVGVMAAKAISLGTGVPFIAVNHLEAHALSARLCSNIQFPYLLLLVSGGHCQILIVKGHGSYRRLGTTIDDALGEAFDKVAKMLGLKFPGGPEVEMAAINGDPKRFKLPRPMIRRKGCDFSFSGLKTSVRQTIEKLSVSTPSNQDKCDLCAAFQLAAGDVLEDRCKNAIKIFREEYPNGNTLVVAGGVASNNYLRKRMTKMAESLNMTTSIPPSFLCTDNGAMVAWAGIEKFVSGEKSNLNFAPKPRWPLDPNAVAAPYAGKKA